MRTPLIEIRPSLFVNMKRFVNNCCRGLGMTLYSYYIMYVLRKGLHLLLSKWDWKLKDPILGMGGSLRDTLPYPKEELTV